jgi:hypothetical protein|nr:hypothetical protein [Kofleriaceae bacterium]
MGRLEDILARNRQANRPKERVFVGIVVGVFILVILGLAAFTDLGDPPPDPDDQKVEAPAPPTEHVIHVPLVRVPSSRSPGSGHR